MKINSMLTDPQEMRRVRLNQPRLTCAEAEAQLRRNWLDVIGRGKGMDKAEASSNGRVSTVGSPIPARKGTKAIVGSFKPFFRRAPTLQETSM